MKFTDDPRVKILLSKFGIKLNDNNEHHILIFRRIIEVAMSQGRWAGTMAQSS